MGSATAAVEKGDGSPTPETEEKTEVQLEPSQEEMERERLTSKAEQVNKEASLPCQSKLMI